MSNAIRLEDLLYKPGVSHLLRHNAVSLASAVVTSCDISHSLVTPAGTVSYLVGSKRKSIPTGNGFGVGKSRKLKQLGCLGWSWAKETLFLDTTSACEMHLNFFPKNTTVLVME